MSKTANSDKNLALVRQMGAAPHEGYNPIPPRSHRWMMDVDQPEEIRVQGWALWRTIDYDPEGRTGPPKKSRTHYAHDERAGRGGHLRTKHIAEDLDVEESNVSRAIDKAVEKGLIRIDEKDRICPRGDAPEPRRIHSEDTGEGEDGEEPIFICTNKSPEAIYLYFQQLDKNRRAQYVRLYRDMPEPFAKHLEGLDDERRGWHTWHYLQAAEYAEQVEADAIAAARNHVRRPLIEGVCAESGYISEETRGRKEVKRELTIELNVRLDPERFFVRKNEPNSVQNGNSNLYKGKTDSAQITASLLRFQRLQRSQSEVGMTSVENPAAEQEKEAAAPRPGSSPTPPTTPPQNQANEVESSLVTDAVEFACGRKLARTDPLRGQIADLGKRFRIPDSSVCRWIRDKVGQKQKARAKVFTPGAWYQFACKDLPDWIKQHSREIDSDRKQEESQRRMQASGDKAFDPAAFNGEIKALAAKKGML